MHSGCIQKGKGMNFKKNGLPGICLVINANTTHAEGTETSLDQAMSALGALVEAKIPFAFGACQIDYQLQPTLEAVAEAPGVYRLTAPKTHLLLQHADKERAAYQLEGLDPDTLLFPPEYSGPSENSLPEKGLFLVSAYRATGWSFDPEGEQPRIIQPVAGPPLAEHPAIKVGGRTGIVMRGYEDLLYGPEGYYEAQRQPQTHIDIFLDHALHLVASRPWPMIMNIDFEGAYLWPDGDRFWQLFAAKLAKHELRKWILPMDRVIEWAAPRAIEAPMPKIVTHKWVGLPDQDAFRADKIRLKPSWRKLDDYELRVASIADTSDIPAAMRNRERLTSKRVVPFPAYGLDGVERQVIIEKRNDWLIDLGFECLRHLRRRQDYLAQRRKGRSDLAVPMPFSEICEGLAHKHNSEVLRRLSAITREWSVIDEIDPL